MDSMILRVMLDEAEKMGASGLIGSLVGEVPAIFVEFSSLKKMNRWIAYIESSFSNVRYSCDGFFMITWIEE